MRALPFAVIVSGVSLFWTAGASATVPLDARFTAARPCAALVSIRRGTNPDGAVLVPGRVYRVIGKNRSEASHYRIRLEGADPVDRWVEADCGDLAVAAREAPDGAVDGATGGLAEESSPPGRFVLAVNWHPAFCETRRGTPECRDQTPAPAATDFSLHGLWPQPRERIYCGLDERHRGNAERGAWKRLPALDLDNATRARLETAMPGTRSYLHRYQWSKHGTCYGMDADAYFRHSLALLEQINASGVRVLFERNIGRHLSARKIRERFDSAFGRRAGERVRVRCAGGLISELQIALRGRLSDSASLSRLIRAAKPRSAGCRGGRIDAAGYDGRRR